MSLLLFFVRAACNDNVFISDEAELPLAFATPRKNNQ